MSYTGQAGQTVLPNNAVMPFVLEKTMKKDGTGRYCQNEECDYKMAVDYIETVLTDAPADAATTENR
jgi:hypothetical protein